jgi:hypothetical protein
MPEAVAALLKMIFTHHLAKVVEAVAEDLADMVQPLLVLREM